MIQSCLAKLIGKDKSVRMELQRLEKEIRELTQRIDQAMKGKSALASQAPQFPNIFFGLINLGGAGSQEAGQGATNAVREEDKLKKDQLMLKELRNQYDLIVAKECPFCSFTIVEDVFSKFEDKTEEADKWVL